MFLLLLLLLLLFLCWVMSDFLPPQWLQHTRLPCLSLSPRVCSNSCSLSCQRYLTVSSSANPFCCLHFPASGSFPVNTYGEMNSWFIIRWPKYWSFSFSINHSLLLDFKNIFFSNKGWCVFNTIGDFPLLNYLRTS